MTLERIEQLIAEVGMPDAHNEAWTDYHEKARTVALLTIAAELIQLTEWVKCIACHGTGGLP